MNTKMIGKILSRILVLESLFMIPSLLISAFSSQLRTFVGFATSIGILAGASFLLFLYGKKAKKGFYAKEGLVCVGLSWALMSLFGALPFFISGEIPSFIDALFEIVSGFTTTGATILQEVETLTYASLYWRSFSHWLGGMGVLVFILAITPTLTDSGGFSLHLLKAESTGPDVGKIAPKMRQTAGILYLLYVGFTVLDVIFLLIGGMQFPDALCIAFGTAGTGGFGVLGDSIASYPPFIQYVCMIFMLIFGINFSCYHLIILRQFRSFFKNEELRFYLITVAVSTGLIAWNISGMYASFEETFRHAAFQTSSIITTTGYTTVDFDTWPVLSKSILMILMVIGACAGSTGGGLKCARVLLLFKSAKRSFRKMLRPNRIEAIHMNGQVIDEKVVTSTNTYFAIYAMITVVSFLIVSIDSPTVLTSFTAVISCVNNIGPGLESVGASQNFAFYSVFSKIVLIVDMLAGRLELFPVLVLFSSAWRKK